MIHFKKIKYLFLLKREFIYLFTKNKVREIDRSLLKKKHKKKIHEIKRSSKEIVLVDNYCLDFSAAVFEVVAVCIWMFFVMITRINLHY